MEKFNKDGSIKIHETTWISRSIGVNNNAKTNVRWFKHKDRLPRKTKKWMKQKYPLRWMFMAFGYTQNKNL